MPEEAPVTTAKLPGRGMGWNQWSWKDTPKIATGKQTAK